MKSTPRRQFRLGLPKGRLLPFSHEILNVLGIVNPDPRQYQFHLHHLGISLFFLKLRDIPQLVHAQVLDAGVSTDEWISDDCNITREVSATWWNVYVALLATESLAPASNAPVVVATEFPWIAEKYLRSSYPLMSVIRITGSGEAMVPFLADAVVDCIQTGATARSNGLVVAKRLMDSSLHVITPTRTQVSTPPALFEVFQRFNSYNPPFLNSK